MNPLDIYLWWLRLWIRLMPPSKRLTVKEFSEKYHDIYLETFRRYDKRN